MSELTLHMENTKKKTGWNLASSTMVMTFSCLRDNLSLAEDVL